LKSCHTPGGVWRLGIQTEQMLLSVLDAELLNVS